MGPFGTASWESMDFDPQRVARDEATVRRGFWSKIRRVAAGLPFAEDLLAAYYCAFDFETPFKVKAALLAALAYFVLPFDFMPDVLPMLGFTDDAAVLATAIRMVAANIRPEHRNAARAAIARQLRA
ncbi:MAG TPA: YkvA family protein [Xanthobacteraceae bacterium]|nr:YkvA family protein [Xanthobacteraceae bacterium]